MKIALITDTHAGARNDSHVFNEYFIKFWEEQFFPYLEEHNIDTVIHLGDVFDRRKYCNFHTLSSWRQRVFDKLHSMGVTMHVIIGNHDIYWKNTNQINSVTEILRQYDNIKIYEETTETNFDGLDIIFVPWINPENSQTTFDLIENTKAEVLMGHLEILGFEMHRGHVNHDQGVSKNIFRKFDMVFSGHFHHKSSDRGIHYLGSPYEMVWSDWGDSRGFHVFDTETRNFTFIENHRKIFYKTFYNDEKETLETLLDQDFDKFKDLYVKIIVDKKTNPYWFDQYIDAIYAANPSDLKIVESVLEDEDNDEYDEDSLDAKDTLTILTDYVEGMQITEMKNELIDVLRTLYTEAANMDIE